MTKRIGILTGGGDAPGLNAVIRGASFKLIKAGYEVVGLLEGWRGLLTGEHMDLDLNFSKKLIYKGGTILGSSRTNLFKDPEKSIPTAKATIASLNLHGLIACGGEDTLGVAMKLNRDENINIVGCPKTIDNDISGTDATFGFDTAINNAANAIDDLRTTAKSHRRVMVVEVMGRHAGWIAAHVGMATGADYTLLPERKIDLATVCEALQRARETGGKNYNMVVVSEGATFATGSFATKDAEIDEFGHVKLGGIGHQLATMIEEQTGFESRHVVLGHTQRAGKPSAADRVLGSRFGICAAEQVIAENWGTMVALKGTEVVPIVLDAGIETIRTVDDDFISNLELFFE